jgi:hypothetical protein
LRKAKAPPPCNDHAAHYKEKRGEGNEGKSVKRASKSSEERVVRENELARANESYADRFPAGADPATDTDGLADVGLRLVHKLHDGHARLKRRGIGLQNLILVLELRGREDWWRCSWCGPASGNENERASVLACGGYLGDLGLELLDF